MSAATTTPTAPPTSTNGTHTSPVDYVRALPPEDKQAVLAMLLREVIELNGGGNGLIPFETSGGDWLGYYVPPKAAAWLAERDLPKLTPEREAEIARRIKNPGPTLTAEEVIVGLRDEAEALRKQGR